MHIDAPEFIPMQKLCIKNNSDYYFSTGKA